MTYFYSKDFSRTLIITMLLLATSLISFSQIENCNAKLEVENNQVAKKASIIGTSYKMSLKNLASKTTTFKIDLKNMQSKHVNEIAFRGALFPVNKGMSSARKASNKSNSNYYITLKRGEQFDFIVELLAPKGVKMGSSNTTEVLVTSDDCSNFSVSKKLYTKIKNSIIQQH